MSEDKKAVRIDHVVLPMHDEELLQDQDDAVIWQKLQILLMAVDQCTAEFGHAGDATRQLKLVTQEAVRRDMFGFSVREREPGVEQLWTWYQLLKQLLDGEATGAWDKTEGTERQYTEVILALKELGEEMPRQEVGLESLDLAGEIIV